MKPYYSEAGITIYHGDCRNYFDVISRMQLMCTDPPYGISLQNHDKDVEGSRPGGWKIAGDDNQDMGQFVLDYWEGAPTITFASPMKPWGGNWRQHLVWYKGPAVGGGGNPDTHWKLDHELIQVRALGKLSSGRDTSVITDWITPSSSPFHPAQKPSSLISNLMSKLSFTSVCDPFMGSGTTLVAAKMLAWEAIGIELEERYCEIAANRLRQSVFNFEEKSA